MNDEQRFVDTPAAAAESAPTSGALIGGAATHDERWWRAKIRGRKLANQWIISAIGGGMAISLFGTPQLTDPLLVILRLLIPVLIMALYASIGYRYAQSAGKYLNLRSALVGQLADSLYFLGFLWTLWALIDSFVIHQMSIAEAVFRAFAYALVTTAAGMFLRMMLLQFAYSVEDQIALGERTVEEEIRRFSAELARTVEGITSFRIQTNSALTGWIDSLNKSTGGLKTVVDEVKEQTAGLKDAMMEMQKANAENIGKLVETALSQFTQKVEPSFHALNEMNRQFIAEVDANATALKQEVKVSTQNLTQSLDSNSVKVEAAFSAAVENIETWVREETKRIQSGLSSGADGISRSLEKSTLIVDKATTKFAASLSAQMANLESSLTNVSKQIREIHVPRDIIEKTIAQQVATTAASLEASTRALDVAIKTIEKSVLRMAKQVERKPWWKVWD